MITTECINCNACFTECPNEAIYEPGANWTLGDKTYGNEPAPSGADGFWSADFFYIVPDKCTECKGYFDEPQCAKVCPVDCCVPDPKHLEDEETLLKKKKYLEALMRG